MREEFLIYLWENQLFDNHNLKTWDNKPVKILDKGKPNIYEGPDFHQARIVLDGIDWYGDIEIHIEASMWENHKHNRDKKYNRTILHIVWEIDKQVYREDTTLLPTISLKDRVPKDLYEKYQKLIHAKPPLLCQSFYSYIPQKEKKEMQKRTLKERLYRKSGEVMAIYDKSKKDWESTAYQLIASSFGSLRNKQNFFRLTTFLPLKRIQKHIHSPIQVEALVFGTAGFLSNNLFEEDAYFTKLKKEFHFLQHKYQISKHNMMEQEEWFFYRVRPQAFPTLRLAFFIQFLLKAEHIFSTMMNDIVHIKEILSSLMLPSYWQEHYQFTKKNKIKIKKMTKQTIYHILINGIVCLWYSYGFFMKIPSYKENAFLLLESLPPEKNEILRFYENVGEKISNCSVSQGCIELYNQYCVQKKCIQCNIGIQIINS